MGAPKGAGSVLPVSGICAVIALSNPLLRSCPEWVSRTPNRLHFRDTYVQFRIMPILPVEVETFFVDADNFHMDGRSVVVRDEGRLENYSSSPILFTYRHAMSN